MVLPVPSFSVDDCWQVRSPCRLIFQTSFTCMIYPEILGDEKERRWWQRESSLSPAGLG